MPPVALTIAGSDPSGGAGLQADLKTFHQHGVYGMSAVTLITVQNTVGVRSVAPLSPKMVEQQVRAVTEDIQADAVKTGALGTPEIISAVVSVARQMDAPLIVDPVMISKHGAPLLDDPAIDALQELLLPIATLITPNAPEATRLSGIEVVDATSAERAAREISRRGAWAVLVKGGHLDGRQAADILLLEGRVHELSAPRIDTPHTHGTGCTYSAAITARLALGHSLLEAVAGAKSWLTEAIRNAPQLGRGFGPVEHLTPVESK